MRNSTNEMGSDPPPDAATYTVPDLARLMRCSPRHVHRLNDQGAIPGVIRIGRLLRFSKRLVDEYLAGGAGKTD